MQIPLNHFEQYIDERILDRGISYFENGHVTSFEELSPGVFEAIVEGTDDYEVSLTILNNNVTEYSCTCPYEYGSVCKHIVAVLYYLQQEEVGIKQSGKKKKGARKPATKRKTVSEQVDELLDSVSHDDLKTFIKEQCISDPEFRRSFLSGFLYKTSAESPVKYRQHVKNILRSAMGRDRFIDWSSAGVVGKAVFGLLGMAMKHVESGNFMSAIFICLPVAEEMVNALDFADDSNGDIGSNIETVFEILNKIASEEIPEDVRLYFFKQCLDLHRKGVFSGWDWHLTILHLASLLAESDSEAESVFLLLDNPGLSEYQNEEAEDIKYELLKKMKGDTEAEKFMEQNIDNPELRRKAIDKALKGGKYDMAISLARDGISLDSKDKPGLAKEWYDWLLRVVIAQKDKPRIIEYAHFLFVDGFRQDQDYYSILKQHIEPAEWAGYVEGLVNEIRSKDRWSKFDVIGKIYITEKWWDRLLKLVSETRHLPYIQHYEQYLSDKYPSELAVLYEKGITDYLKKMTGRDHYKEACRYMRRMIKLGASDRVNKLVANLRKEYPLRKALMDELNKI